ncbi:hypothetical protein DFR42_11555 [Undibacterium pigrum]|uniref:Uncharacterized protein n=1 Tax=Undibacterium pigrum TaxID=401470 RepID=A0A318IR01_9BURK|nr:hypothetical protein DFR42_11555 [Undibacterium pigrum]
MPSFFEGIFLGLRKTAPAALQLLAVLKYCLRRYGEVGISDNILSADVTNHPCKDGFLKHGLAGTIFRKPDNLADLSNFSLHLLLNALRRLFADSGLVAKQKPDSALRTKHIALVMPYPLHIKIMMHGFA